MESENCNKLVNRTEEKDSLIKRTNLWSPVWEREVETGSIGIGDEDIQNIMYKLSYNNRMYNTGHIAKIL